MRSSPISHMEGASIAVQGERYLGMPVAWMLPPQPLTWIAPLDHSLNEDED